MMYTIVIAAVVPLSSCVRVRAWAMTRTAVEEVGAVADGRGAKRVEFTLEIARIPWGAVGRVGQVVVVRLGA